MKVHRFTRFSVLVLLLGLTAVACDESTGPAGDFDPEEAAATVEEMLTAVDTEELEDAYAGLNAVGYLFQGLSTDFLSGVPVSLDPTIVGPGAGPLADVIPNEYEGTTFEFDPSQGYYVMSEATGAPSDGIRVLYYAVDPTTGQPATPLNQLGHVDVRDLSDASADRLGIEIVRTSGGSPVTLADYTFSLSFTETQSSGSVDVSSVGFLSNGTNQLNFDISFGVSYDEIAGTFTADQSVEMDLEGTDNALSYQMSTTQNFETGAMSMTVDVEISTGARTVAISMSYDGTELTGSVMNNGEVVVNISGNPDNPTFTNAAGDPLSSQERQALEQLWEDVGSMFEFVGELFGFATGFGFI